MSSMIPFPNSSISVRHPCFSPLQPWISWPSNRSHISQCGKQRQCGTDFKTPCLFYLFHGDGCLDSWGHCIHPSTHPQEIHRLVFLSDGILCVDSRHFHISLLDSLEDTQIQSTSVSVFRGWNVPSQILATEVQLTFFTLAFSTFSSLSHFPELLCSCFAANFKLKRFSTTWG